MNLKERYQKEIAPQLKQELGIANLLALPRVQKVTVSVGLSQGVEDPRFWIPLSN